MKKAIDIAIEKGILKEFLIRHSAEVRNMLTLEYNEEVAKRVEREEARAELIKSCLRKITSCEAVAEMLDLPLEEVQRVKDTM